MNVWGSPLRLESHALVYLVISHQSGQPFCANFSHCIQTSSRPPQHDDGVPHAVAMSPDDAELCSVLSQLKVQQLAIASCNHLCICQHAPLHQSLCPYPMLPLWLGGSLLYTTLTEQSLCVLCLACCADPDAYVRQTTSETNFKQPFVTI